MPATSFAVNQSLEYTFIGSGSYASLPSYWYLGLSTTPIDSDGNGVTEPSDITYSRQAIQRSGNAWTTATSPNCVLYNKIEVSFKKSSEHWGTISDVFLATSSTGSGSYIWYHMPLPNGVPILEETLISFPANSIKIARK